MAFSKIWDLASTMIIKSSVCWV